MLCWLESEQKIIIHTQKNSHFQFHTQDIYVGKNEDRIIALLKAITGITSWPGNQHTVLN